MSDLLLEDSLAKSLADYFAATPPAVLPVDFPLVYFRQKEKLPENAVIFGHEGSARIPSMDGTAHVNLRIAVRTSMDDTATPPAVHSAISLALDKAIMALDLKPGPLPLIFLHTVHRITPIPKIDDRRQLTLLSYRITATRCEAEDEDEE